MPAAALRRMPRQELEEAFRTQQRELRVWREREQDFEERYQGPADVEGIAGRPGVIILRDKNMAEVKRVIDDLPNLPYLRLKDDEGNPDYSRPALGYDRAVYYAQSEVAKMIYSIAAVGPYNTSLVSDRHRLMMWVENRAGFLIRPDAVGERLRADLFARIVSVFYGPAVPHLIGTSHETEVEPVEAERKAFG